MKASTGKPSCNANTSRPSYQNYPRRATIDTSTNIEIQEASKSRHKKRDMLLLRGSEHRSSTSIFVCRNITTSVIAPRVPELDSGIPVSVCPSPSKSQATMCVRTARRRTGVWRGWLSGGGGWHTCSLCRDCSMIFNSCV